MRRGLESEVRQAVRKAIETQSGAPAADQPEVIGRGGVAASRRRERIELGGGLVAIEVEPGELGEEGKRLLEFLLNSLSLRANHNLDRSLTVYGEDENGCPTHTRENLGKYGYEEIPIRVSRSEKLFCKRKNCWFEVINL